MSNDTSVLETTSTEEVEKDVEKEKLVELMILSNSILVLISSVDIEVVVEVVVEVSSSSSDVVVDVVVNTSLVVLASMSLEIEILRGMAVHCFPFIEVRKAPAGRLDMTG